MGLAAAITQAKADAQAKAGAPWRRADGGVNGVTSKDTTSTDVIDLLSGDEADDGYVDRAQNNASAGGEGHNRVRPVQASASTAVNEDPLIMEVDDDAVVVCMPACVEKGLSATAAHSFSSVKTAKRSTNVGKDDARAVELVTDPAGAAAQTLFTARATHEEPSSPRTGEAARCTAAPRPNVTIAGERKSESLPNSPVE